MHLGLQILGADIDLDNLDQLFDQIPTWNKSTLENVDTDSGFKLFLQDILEPDPDLRPDLYALLNHSFLQNTNLLENPSLRINKRLPKLWSKRPHISDAELPDITLEDLFNFWRVSGGQVEFEVRNAGTGVKPAIFIIPSVVKSADNILELISLKTNSIFSDEIVNLNLDKIFTLIRTARQQVHTGVYDDQWKYVYKWKSGRIDKVLHSIHIKPAPSTISAKEKDVIYQYHRHVKFRHLLNLFPSSYNEIKIAAVLDIPPVYSI